MPYWCGNKHALNHSGQLATASSSTQWLGHTPRNRQQKANSRHSSKGEEGPKVNWLVNTSLKWEVGDAAEYSDRYYLYSKTSWHCTQESKTSGQTCTCNPRPPDDILVFKDLLTMYSESKTSQTMYSESKTPQTCTHNPRPPDDTLVFKDLLTMYSESKTSQTMYSESKTSQTIYSESKTSQTMYSESKTAWQYNCVQRSPDRRCTQNQRLHRQCTLNQIPHRQYTQNQRPDWQYTCNHRHVRLWEIAVFFFLLSEKQTISTLNKQYRTFTYNY